jgi:hypothetical protein
MRCRKDKYKVFESILAYKNKIFQKLTWIGGKTTGPSLGTEVLRSSTASASVKATAAFGAFVASLDLGGQPSSLPPADETLVYR